MRLTEKDTRMVELDVEELKDLKEPKIYNKLADLEDFEDEIGIDLITLFNALKYGVYVKPWNTIKFSFITLSFNDKTILYDKLDNDYNLKDYGKTWALTKEELE